MEAWGWVYGGGRDVEDSNLEIDRREYTAPADTLEKKEKNMRDG